MSNVIRGPFPGLPSKELEKRLIEARKYGSYVAHGIRFVRQRGSSDSIWGALVREGLIEGKAICWAFHFTPDWKKAWLACRLDTGRGKPVFCDLRTLEGRKKLNEIEKECKRLLLKRRASRE